MKLLDKFINDITMYRLVLFSLIAIIVAAFISSFTVGLGFTPLSLISSLATILLVSFLADFVLVRLFKSAPSIESWIITALILFLILKPASSPADYAILVLGSVLAVSSKYILTYRNRHIINPVIFALVVLGLLGSGEVFWWVGSKIILPVVIIVGYLIVRKIRRFDMVLLFIAVALATTAVSRGFGDQTLNNVTGAILSGPLIFFAVIMLTEPQTSPHTKKLRLLFAVIVGVLFGLQFKFLIITSSPELALLVGNMFAFAVTSKRRLRLELQTIKSLGHGIYQFDFKPETPLDFKPGQYLEWTLPHRRADARGDRRYFTIASSPSEELIKLVVRIDPEKSSSFKRALLIMKPGDLMWGACLSGDFQLSHNHAKPTVMISGGIGITPIRSMIQQLVDTGQHRTVTLYYSAQTVDSFTYWELFNQAVNNGVRPYYVITGQDVPDNWTGKTGRLTADMIKTDVSDYKHAIYYLSGPSGMVDGYRRMLRKAGVRRKQIRTDYFPGF